MQKLKNIAILHYQMPTSKKSIKEYNNNYREWLENKGLGHSHLEKPAMYSMLGDIKNKKILCLGCGAGEECEYLLSQGAKQVVGIDISKSLIKIAQKSYPHIKFSVMDMEKIDYSDSSFDFVYSSLVLHYVKDWTQVLQEINRVLKSNGIFLFSTHNPVYWGFTKEINNNEKVRRLGYRKNLVTKQIEVFGDYLKVKKIRDIWYNNFKVTYYHKPFSFMIKEIISSGFKIIECQEPKPTIETKKIAPEFWKKASRIPLFIIFKLKK